MVTKHYCYWKHHSGPAIAILCLGHSSMKSRSGTQTTMWLALEHHVKMNSWCKFGECSTHRSCYIDLTISSYRLNHYSLTIVIQA